MLELTSKEIRARFTTLGARLLALEFAGADLLAGGGTDRQCLDGDWTAGAICGRMAGRISNARFSLDGSEYRLTPNVGEHQLHGGPDNFAIRHWDVEQSDKTMRFTLASPDGDQGYPGSVEASAAYRLDGGVLRLDLEARASRPTIVNMTNHGYWNLSGGARGAFAHDMQIHGRHFLPLDDLLMPTGEIREVAGTRWDFRTPRRVGEAYDNCWAIDGERGSLRCGLILRDAVSGRRMEVWTTEAGIQMYTANHWTAAMPGKNGPLQPYGAIAIEAQNFPDALNHQGFPSSVLRPGETYRNRIEWRFG